MNRKNYSRSAVKRIWEVDCLSLGASLAASFEWKELANFVPNFHKTFNKKYPEEILEMQLHDFIHAQCHTTSKISLRVENTLNNLHRDRINVIRDLNPQEVMQVILRLKFEDAKGLGGLFWAIATDSREGFTCIARRLHQRFQLVSIHQAMRKTA